jgi:glycerate dehydrogenase
MCRPLSGGMKIVVLDAGTLAFDDAVWSALGEFGDVQLYVSTSADAETIIQRIGEAEVVFTNKVPLSAEVLEAAVSLKFIGVLATGYNVVDVAAAARLGQTLCNVPAYGATTTAQHAVALILELCNQVGRHSASVHAGDWVRSELFSYWKQAPRELAAMTIGIVGLGTIGRRVAAAVNAMGARVLASARTERDTPDYDGFEWASNDVIFERADLVSLHCPETSQTSGFVDAALLATMKRGALLVNTARGGLVCEVSLAAALRSGALGGAAVDVLCNEPMAADCPLLGAPNCLITPHIAWASEPARHRLFDTSVDNLRQFIAGHPVNVVQNNI